ncbi:hypothetical protein LP421_19715 [Rhizobium sp. RCAM05350]|nr:hypothetical protein LP421_19715 [Rhizobium sp. RCAM05350]
MTTPWPPRSARAQIVPDCSSSPGIAVAAHPLDQKRGVAAEADLGAVGEENGKLAGGVGAQHVAAQEVLLQIDVAPAGNIDEAHLLAGFAGNDRSGGGGWARQRVSLRRHGETERSQGKTHGCIFHAVSPTMHR